MYTILQIIPALFSDKKKARNNPGLQLCLFTNIQSARQAHLHCSFCTSITSSPRMWGISLAASFFLLLMRFIPTHVGHMFPPPHHRHKQAVHPHACGAYAFKTKYKGLVCGSSPRMWGIFVFQSNCSIRIRFIPTHVGHMMKIRFSFIVFSGSSPRMWGIY